MADIINTGNQNLILDENLLLEGKVTIRGIEESSIANNLKVTDLSVSTTSAFASAGISSTNGLTVSAGVTTLLGSTVSLAQWGYVANLNQSLNTSNSVSFAGISSTNGLGVIAGTTTLLGSTVSSAQWSYVANLNQGLRTTNSVAFAGISSTSGLSVSAGTTTLLGSTVSSAQWSYVANLNQGLNTSNSVAFAGISSTSGLSVSTGTTTFNSSGIRILESGASPTQYMTMNVATLTADRTYTIPETSTNCDFVMTAGNQAIAGNKDFAGDVKIVSGKKLIVDKIESNTIDQSPPGMVPIGGVVSIISTAVWTQPTQDEIKDGFALCNGRTYPIGSHASLTGSRPDLRNRFIRGGAAGGTNQFATPGSLAGSDSHSHTVATHSSHTHTAYGHHHGFALNTDSTGNHSHTLNNTLGGSGAGATVQINVLSPTSGFSAGYIGSDGLHQHGVYGAVGKRSGTTPLGANGDDDITTSSAALAHSATTEINNSIPAHSTVIWVIRVI